MRMFVGTIFFSCIYLYMIVPIPLRHAGVTVPALDKFDGTSPRLLKQFSIEVCLCMLVNPLRPIAQKFPAYISVYINTKAYMRSIDQPSYVSHYSEVLS